MLPFGKEQKKSPLFPKAIFSDCWFHAFYQR